jgi:hypothetical protein
MKPTLKAPGAKRLKLENDETISSFGFKFNLRRYSVMTARSSRDGRRQSRLLRGNAKGFEVCTIDHMKAGAYTRSLHSST